MNKVRKTVIALIGILLVNVLVGCGSKFDAAGYTKALLDNSYKNDSTDFVKMKIGTAEDASNLYEQGIDAELEAMVAATEISDSLKADFESLLREIFARAKYTVVSAEKQSDDSYVVTINYQQLKVFGTATKNYMTEVNKMVEEWSSQAAATGSIPTDEEMYEKVFEKYRDCLKEQLGNATYGDEQTTTVRIELKDNVYSPNKDDVANLEMLFFDVDEAQQSM
jgi:nitrogen regulatory protein PII-like uncharacterized protein